MAPRPADCFKASEPRPGTAHRRHFFRPRDGMRLGRCVLSDEHDVGVLRAKYKVHPRLFCSLREDEFMAPFHPLM
jgi:hypothetical protein